MNCLDAEVLEYVIFADERDMNIYNQIPTYVPNWVTDILKNGTCS